MIYEYIAFNRKACSEEILIIYCKKNQNIKISYNTALASGQFFSFQFKKWTKSLKYIFN
jgi:hypothetical protein